MGALSKAKGKKAEQEVASMLREAVERAYASVEMKHGLEWLLDRPVIVRNQNQPAVGGYDVDGIAWMACEVKHHADVSGVNVWWQQTVRQTRAGQMPVLFYRGNGTRWKVRTCATLQGMPGRELSVEHWCVVDVEAVEFMTYVLKRLTDDAEAQYRTAMGDQ